ncbi:MAG: carbohydrate kinase family protein [Armatimonadota bacterium]
MTPDLDVLVIGSAMVEITPAEMGQPLSEVAAMIPLPSGSAANFAAVLASLGVNVALMTRVGDDELGRWLIDRLRDRGISTDFALPVAGQRTPVSFAWMDQGGEKTFYFYRFPGFSDPMSSLMPNDISADEVRRCRLFDFTEAAIRNEPLRSASLAGAALAREEGREVCYAMNYRPSAWLNQTEDEIVSVQRRACASADIVLMNSEEATIVTGENSAERAATEISRLGPTFVVVTDGENGATVLSDGSTAHVPARDVEVVYDIGAGDTFHAGLLAAHIAGMGPETAARFASDAAALRISRDAAQPNPTFDEVRGLSAEEAR